MGKYINIPLEEFKKFYIDENHTIPECAEYFGCSSGPIRRMIVEHNLGKNPWSEEAKRNFWNTHKPKERRFQITKEKLQELYIEKNWSLKECAKFYGCTVSTILLRVNEFQIFKDPMKAAKNREKSNLERYGVANCASLPQVQSKMKATTRERYGVDHPLQSREIREKAKMTLIQKYGVSVPLKSEQIKHKALMTNLERYGVPNPAQQHISKEALETTSSRETMRKFILEQKDKSTFGLAEKLGYTPLHMVDIIHKWKLEKYVTWGNGRSSHYERDIKRWLKEQGYLFYNTRTIIPPQELDLYNEEHQLAIEFNGDYWHGLKALGDKKYHLKKSLACEAKGIRLIHIWEHEWNNPRQQAIYKNIVLSALQDKRLKKIYARKCSIEVRPSKTMREFFDRNNIQGFRGGKFAICLIHEGKVVMSYIMGRCHFGKGKYDWEVIRGATELGYYVVGGASKIWKYFMREYQPKNCVYYVDFNQFNGKSVEKLGFKYLTTRLSFRNYWVKEQKVTNRDPSHHKEIKDLMATGEVLPLWNAGVKVYAWGEPNF